MPTIYVTRWTALETARHTKNPQHLESTHYTLTWFSGLGAARKAAKTKIRGYIKGQGGVPSLDDRYTPVMIIEAWDVKTTKASLIAALNGQPQDLAPANKKLPVEVWAIGNDGKPFSWEGGINDDPDLAVGGEGWDDDPEPGVWVCDDRVPYVGMERRHVPPTDDAPELLTSGYLATVGLDVDDPEDSEPDPGGAIKWHMNHRLREEALSARRDLDTIPDSGILEDEESDVLFGEPDVGDVPPTDDDDDDLVCPF
jgi:hypothetical protein